MGISLLSWAIESSLAVAPGNIRIANEQHRKVFDAIRRGEPVQAEAAMIGHLEAVKIRYQQEVRRRMT